MTRRIAAVALAALMFVGGTAFAHHGGSAQSVQVEFPDCFEDSVVVIIVGHWDGTAQRSARAAVACAAVDDLYYR